MVQITFNIQISFQSIIKLIIKLLFVKRAWECCEERPSLAAEGSPFLQVNNLDDVTGDHFNQMIYVEVNNVVIDDVTSDHFNEFIYIETIGSTM